MPQQKKYCIGTFMKISGYLLGYRLTKKAKI